MTASLFPRRLTFALFAALLFFAPLARGAVQPWAQSALMTMACLLAAAMLVEKALTGVVIAPKTVLGKPFLALAALICLSLVFSPTRADSLEAIGLLAVYTLIFYAARHLAESRAGQRQVVYLLIALATVVALLALIKCFSPQLIPIWWQYDLDKDNGAIAAGPYGNHNHLAGLLEMIIPLTLALFITRERRGAGLLLLLSLATLLTATHILTLSRGGWFSLAAALSVMVIILLAQRRFTRKKMLLGVVGGTALVFLFILGGGHIVDRLLTLTNETALDFAGRTVAWKGCLSMIAAHPLLGSGPGSFSTLFPAWQPPGIAARFFYAHNNYLQYAAELGLPVLAIILWIAILLTQRLIRLVSHPSRQIRGISLGAAIGILATVFHSFVDFNLHIPANAAVFATLLGLLSSMAEKDRTKRNHAVQ
jgi:O-antigen ligase